MSGPSDSMLAQQASEGPESAICADLVLGFDYSRKGQWIQDKEVAHLVGIPESKSRRSLNNSAYYYYCDILLDC